ncbi:MAG: arginine deiminase family protein [Gaiellaceae bacterium]
MTAALRRVLVRRPGGLERWREFGWRAEPDAARVEAEHEALRAALADAGAEVVVAEPLAGNPDAVYVYDPAVIHEQGAVLLRPGKAARQAEPEALRAELERAGMTILGRLQAPAFAEGGDTVWLDEHTLAVGLGYRTNEAGAAALAEGFPNVDVLPFDLAHHRGPGEVLHLMSVLSPLDVDLALVHLPLMPARLVQLLRARGVSFVEAAAEEFETLACNVLALGPRRVLAADGNPETRRRLEAAGVEVAVYPAAELGLKGDGGPTCLTRPLVRAG